MSNRSSEFGARTWIVVVALAAAWLAPPGASRASELTDCTGLPNGTVCDDGNACTSGETCRSGYCLAPVSFSQAAGSPITVPSPASEPAAGDFDRDGDLDLAVTNGSVNSVTILLGDGSGGYSAAPGSPIATGTTPRAVVADDWDGDGKLDLAIANLNGANVTILMGDGAGGLSAAAGSPVAVGTTPSSIAVGDWNANGTLDLAVTNGGTNNVTILLGNGTGGFSVAAGSPVAVGTNPQGAAAGDWNGDGRLDLVVTNSGTNDVTILLGNGSGGLTAAAGSPVAVGTQPNGVVAGDWNGDGRLDLAVANSLSNNASILLGDGAGGFVPAAGSPIAAGTKPPAIRAADLNQDGRIDLALTGSGGVTILLGNGSAAFSPAAGSPFAAGSSPQGLAVADLDGDRKPDLAVTASSIGRLTILLSTTVLAPEGTACDDGSTCTVGETCRSGRCQPPLALTQLAALTVPLGHAETASAVGDFNGDGVPDLAFAAASVQGVSVLLGDGAGGFSQAAGSPILVDPGPASVAAGDLNRDGKLDLVVACLDGNHVTILLGNGSGGFTQPPGSPLTANSPVHVAIADIDRDGALDIAVAEYNIAGHVRLYFGDGLGGVDAVSDLAVGQSPDSIAVGDLNRDGRPDLAVGEDLSDDVLILLSTGFRTFGTGISVPTGAHTSSIALGDVNADGRLDLAASRFGGGVMVLLGNGSGGFVRTESSPLAAGVEPIKLEMGDLDGNGTLDIVVANRESDDATILLGSGSGDFREAQGSPITLGDYPDGAVIADLDRDGRPDVAIPNGHDNTLSVLLNDTCRNGSCLPPTWSEAGQSPFGTGTNPIAAAVVEVNLDGKLDLAIANQGANSLTVLLGNGAGGFSPAAFSPVTVGTNPVAVATGDVNGDGRPDIVVANATSNNLTVLRGSSTAAGFATNSVNTGGTGPRSVAIAEINSGPPDLVVANRTSDTVSILLGLGTGNFFQATGSPIAVGTAPYAVAVGDLNRDGKLDVAVANDGSSNVTVLLGTGVNNAGEFSQAPGSPVAVGTNPESLAIADLNRDGRLDLAVANAGSDNVTVLLGDGAGGFSAAGSPVAVGTAPASIAVADVDRDGKVDLVVANNGSANLTVLLGNGTGGFSPAPGSPVAAGSGPTFVAARDLTGDGEVDFAVTNFSASTVTVRLAHTVVATDGTSCDDGDACTTADACTSGSCAGGPLPSPAELAHLRFASPPPDKRTIAWDGDAAAARYDVVRGALSTLPVGPGGDETCYPDLPTALLDDPTPTAGGFYYIVRGDNACGGTGTYGNGHTNPGPPSNGPARTTTACP